MFLATNHPQFIDDPVAAARFADTVAAERWSPAQVQERLQKAGSLEEALALFETSPPGDLPLLRAA